MAEPKASRIMTSGQVATLFGVDVTTVGRWADEGMLPHFKTLGGQRRFRRSEVEQIHADQEGQVA